MIPILFGFGLVIGWAAWRNMPPMSDHVSGAAGVLIVLALGGAYWAGGRRRGGGAHATAVASATAVAEGGRASQVLVVNVDAGARRQARAEHGGLDDLEWIDDRPMLTADRVDEDVLYHLAEDSAETRWDGETREARS